MNSYVQLHVGFLHIKNADHTELWAAPVEPIQTALLKEIPLSDAIDHSDWGHGLPHAFLLPSPHAGYMQEFVCLCACTCIQTTLQWLA